MLFLWLLYPLIALLSFFTNAGSAFLYLKRASFHVKESLSLLWRRRFFALLLSSSLFLVEFPLFYRLAFFIFTGGSSWFYSWAFFVLLKVLLCTYWNLFSSFFYPFFMYWSLFLFLFLHIISLSSPLLPSSLQRTLFYLINANMYLFFYLSVLKHIYIYILKTHSFYMYLRVYFFLWICYCTFN